MAIKNKWSDIDLSPYDKGFQGNDATKLAEQKKINAENEFNNLGTFSFNYANQEARDKAMNDYLNRGAFSYDLNADVLYQQYKDNYINQGKMAMMDTMGQAAAMTGGYGNSYAQTVGQQAYQGYLQGLNNMIPELYQMALDRYNVEGDRLKSNFDILDADRQNAYDEAFNEYNAKFNYLSSNRDYYSNDYDNIYNREFTNWTDIRDYKTSQYWNEYNAGYTAEQDAIANELARKQLAASLSRSSGGSGDSTTNYYKALAELGNGIQPVTRGGRGNTGNGGYSVLGSTYKTRDEAEKALTKYLDKLNLSDTQIIAIYEKLGM